MTYTTHLHPQKSIPGLKIAAALLFLLLASYPRSAIAQSNTFPASGNAGIGTTGPGKKLVIQSDTVNDHLSIVRPTTNAATLNIGVDNTGPFFESTTVNRPISFYTHNGTSVGERVRIDKDGKVGIGTGNPLYLHHVVAPYAKTNTTHRSHVFFSSNEADGTPWGLVFNTVGAASLANRYAELQTAERNVADGGNLTLQPRAGNVGIGTTNPTAKLQVEGSAYVTQNLTVDGNIAAKYQDVAEWVPSTRALPAGTVVTLDPTKSNHVESSSQAYDTRVAGVISAQPGIVLGERGENKVLVATTGRVRIKVDASHGPIQVGDLLVTSDIPGLAMKSQPINVGGVQLHRPGTLIGKALEPLAKGRGEILVLLSLQ